MKCAAHAHANKILPYLKLLSLEFCIYVFLVSPTTRSLQAMASSFHASHISELMLAIIEYSWLFYESFGFHE